jgi:hypothetical protein
MDERGVRPRRGAWNKGKLVGVLASTGSKRVDLAGPGDNKRTGVS